MCWPMPSSSYAGSRREAAVAEADLFGAAIRSICDAARADFRKATWRERIGRWCSRWVGRKAQQMKLRLPIVKELVAIAESAHIPLVEPENSCWTFDAKDGWRVLVFYDGGEFDYIEQFISPSGEPVDFWDWPDCPERQALINWRPQ